jgi:hypothetical protein
MASDGMGWYCGDHCMILTLWLSGYGGMGMSRAAGCASSHRRYLGTVSTLSSTPG